MHFLQAAPWVKSLVAVERTLDEDSSCAMHIAHHDIESSQVLWVQGCLCIAGKAFEQASRYKPCFHAYQGLQGPLAIVLCWPDEMTQTALFECSYAALHYGLGPSHGNFEALAMPPKLALPGLHA